MRFLETFQEKIGFTRQEAVAVVTLSSVVIIGAGVRWFQDDGDRAASVRHQFDYTKQDSAFAAITREARSAAQAPAGAVETQRPAEKKVARPAIVNINRASKAELMTLPGIGEVYAGRILEHRRQHGAFSSVNDLLKVKGIGKKKLQKLRPFVRVQ